MGPPTGHKGSNKHYTNTTQELKSLLKTLTGVLPVTPEEWEDIVQTHRDVFLNASQRDDNSIRRKLNAKWINWKLGDKSGLENGHQEFAMEKGMFKMRMNLVILSMRKNFLKGSAGIISKVAVIIANLFANNKNNQTCKRTKLDFHLKSTMVVKLNPNPSSSESNRGLNPSIEQSTIYSVKGIDNLHIQTQQSQQLNVCMWTQKLSIQHVKNDNNHLGWHIWIQEEVSLITMHEIVKDLVVANSTGLNSINLLGVEELGEPAAEWEVTSQTTGTTMKELQKFWVKMFPVILNPKKHKTLAQYTEEVQDERIAALIQANVYSKADISIITAFSTGGPRPVRTWKQWKFYCYGGGVNIFHNTPQCPRKTEVKDFQAHITATKVDPQGATTGRTMQITQPTIKTYKAALLTNLHPLGTTLVQFRALDLAATNRFLPFSYISQDPQVTSDRIQVGCANGCIMVSVGTDLLGLTKVPMGAQGCHKFDEVGVPLVLQHGHCYESSWETVFIGNKKNPGRNLLYMVPLHQKIQAWDAPPPRGVPQDLEGPPRVALGNPAGSPRVVLGDPATLTKAIDKSDYFTRPGLSKQQVAYYLDKNMYNIKGHLSLVRKHIQSTNTTKNLAADKYAKQPRTNKRTALGEQEGTISCDLPVRFPVKSVRGHSHKYLLLNSAEQAIRTFKDHYVAIMSGVDKDYPAYQWDLLVPQTMMTLNFLPPSRINKDISAYSQVKGVFGFNATPLAPLLGCKGFYISPTMKHYRNDRCLVKAIGVVGDKVTAGPQPPEPFLTHRLKLATALGIVIIKDILEPTNPQEKEPKVSKAPKLATKKRPGLSWKGSRGSPNRIEKNVEGKKGEPIVILTTPHLACSGSIWDEEINKWASYRDLEEHEFGRLFQGFEANGTEGMDVLDRIPYCEVLHGEQATYPSCTAGGYRLEKADPITPGSQQEGTDYHIMATLPPTLAALRPSNYTGIALSLPPVQEYVRFKWDLIPPRIIKGYKLEPLAHNGYAYAKIKKAWYGIEGLFLHDEQDILFTLWSMMLASNTPSRKMWATWWNWDFDKWEVEASMDGYVEQAMKELEYECPKQRARSFRDRAHPKGSGKFFYARAINNTSMLNALNDDVASAKDTKETHDTTMYFLNYAVNHPDGSMLEGRTFNAPCDGISSGAPTLPKTNSMTAQEGVLNGTIKQKRSKMINMRFYWLEDRAEQDQFGIFWDSEKHNLADSPNKIPPHPRSHHSRVRPIYLYEPGKTEDAPDNIKPVVSLDAQEQALFTNMVEKPDAGKSVTNTNNHLINEIAGNYYEIAGNYNGNNGHNDDSENIIETAIHTGITSYRNKNVRDYDPTEDNATSMGKYHSWSVNDPI
eukprot:jgi/Psemu1/5986/gm1.5986_g